MPLTTSGVRSSSRMESMPVGISETRVAELVSTMPPRLMLLPSYESICSGDSNLPKRIASPTQYHRQFVGAGRCIKLVLVAIRQSL